MRQGFEPFTCPECGGTVRLTTGPGRTREYRRGVPPLAVPDELPIPTCEDCGDSFVLVETEGELNKALDDRYREWQRDHLARVVALLQRRHDATKRQVASSAGITPSHLSHLLAGQDAASATLLRLFESLAAYPPEFERHLQGRTFLMPAPFPCLAWRAPQEPLTGERFAAADWRWSPPPPPGPANDNVVQEAV
ncbi:MAG: hypothetical protein HY744_25235 [Deltaproteobacteria bacterium]|nr:hypothetical protein [Deltaproteobacteria bacterium]